MYANDFLLLKEKKKAFPNLPPSQYTYLQNVISRFYISNINPLAIYVSVVSVVAARAQTLKNEEKMDGEKKLIFRNSDILGIRDTQTEVYLTITVH